MQLRVKPFTWHAQSPTAAKEINKSYTENKIDFVAEVAFITQR